MAMPRREDIQKEVVEGWRTFVNNLEAGLKMLEEDIDEAASLSEVCTLEWCESVEHVIDELSNSLYSISEASWSSEADSQKIKDLRKRVHDLYAKYKSTASR